MMTREHGRSWKVEVVFALGPAIDVATMRVLKAASEWTEESLRFPGRRQHLDAPSIRRVCACLNSPNSKTSYFMPAICFLTNSLV